ncbi:Holliday junction ATP-dependent DNA helicase RuvA [Paraliobacillus quinghaiensis]|uniref:Holliday junction branch migration complex subunit RuvA n=1 Tax=Paraliobacillus quinghaiensis TaxID=470815 RepID=A0A917TLG4_9BACI|nr:Holliday junction branch migration protein RuvA [Paraliobacillus quinghaiensis]GGM27461.1 Holliday junction ATP-dependent DNA helicase RuvA [Paraliobacillus quinghaiensis]
MIAYINGKLETVTETTAVIEANGVGYEIICANPFRFQDQLGEIVRIYTYHYVREDTQTLFGFSKVEEKTLFARILNVSGIGPKGALSIVATAGVKDFVVAIEEENEKFLTSFPGVGKKTARQMILDLKGKLPFEFDVSADSNDSETVKVSADQIKALDETVEVLKSLGYSDREIKHITPTLKQVTSTNTDELVRKGLALLMQK